MRNEINKKLFYSLLFLCFIMHTRAQYNPATEFRGKMGKTLAESQAWKAEDAVKTPKEAPNVVWILLDDVGFGASSSFGGLIPTPTFDSLANNGLRFTNFHTTAICSPTRAALMTGRNQHSVHMGLFPETAIEFPGYDARMPFEKATIAEVLRENGYSTYAVGKWHLTPVPDASQAGPFNRWPTGRGFDKYFGFPYGETDQYYPQLWEGNNAVEIDTKGKHLTTLLIDKAIGYIADQKSTAPDKPFFLYLPTGAAHAPHQVDQEWLDKFKGKFDGGWDKYREEVLVREKKLGVIPANAVLPPRNPGIRAWDSLSTDEKKIFARFMEAYAAFLAQTDYEIGRLVKYLKQIDQLDNTMIVLMIGDNGASKEGKLTGVTKGIGDVDILNLANPQAQTNQERIKFLMNDYYSIGTQYSSSNYPLGWAMACNTPFKYWKQDANSEGGTHNPMIIFYPKKIKDKGGIRNQYSHVNDILPTTVELTGAKIPAVINGYRQEPVEGTSLAYTIDDPKAVSKHTVQYFEITGSRSLYKDGWKAGTLHKIGAPFDQDKWELYNLNEDFNEVNDLAAKYPEKLKELQDAFDAEARKYNIYPLKDWMSSKFGGDDRSIFLNKKTITLYPGMSQLFAQTGPPLRNKSFSVTADAEIHSATDEGVLFAYGGRYNGLSFFIKDGKLQVAHNTGSNITHLSAEMIIPTGKVKLRFEVNYKNVKLSTDEAGTETLFINGIKVAERTITKADTDLLAYDEGIDVGRDNATPVSDKYKAPFAFTGKLNFITIEYP